MEQQDGILQALKSIATNLRPYDALVVRTQANAGDAGGTIYYLTLGKLKIAFGKTAAISTASGAASNKAITLPTAFFSSILTSFADLIPSATNDQTAQIATESTTTLQLYLYNHSAVTGGGFINWLVIGF
jgi:hypothetical protein